MQDAVLGSGLSAPPRQRGRRHKLPRRFVGGAGIVVCFAALVTVAASQGWIPSDSRLPHGALEIASDPAGAIITVDGRGQGHTPAALSLPAGSHRLTLHHDGFVDANLPVVVMATQTTTLQARLWTLTPDVERLHPMFPGATIDDARFLQDGRVAITIALPPNQERQAWLLNDQGYEQVADLSVEGPMAVSPDGRGFAYLARSRSTGPVQKSLDEVWIRPDGGEAAQRAYHLPQQAPGDALLDLSWAPDGGHLLLVEHEALSAGGFHTRLVWLDTSSGEAAPLVTLPGEIEPGSETWNPGGTQVAFLVRAGQTTSLCLVDLPAGRFHYLADLSREAAAFFPFSPLSWSTAGDRLVYAAPAEDLPSQSGWLFASRPPTTLFLADTAQIAGRRLGQAEAEYPVWREDGSILALAHPHAGGPLVLRSIAADGTMRDLAELPLKLANAYAVRWDTAHAQALVAARDSASANSDSVAYWLLRFDPRRQP